MLDVISIGNATQDVFVSISKEYVKGEVCFVPGQKIEIEGIDYCTGGGAVNSSVAFSRMGLKVGIICALGNDPAGKAVIDDLKREKVNLDLVIKSKDETAYSVILTGFGKDRVILSYKGATASISCKKIMWKKLKAKWLHISSLHNDYRHMEKICCFAKSKGINVSINPGKVELAAGLKNLEKTLRNADVLFLNDSEALSLTGNANIERNLALLQKYSKIAVITAGPKGAYAFDGKFFYYKDTLPVEVVDATGCGDAFNSGFISAICYGKSIEEALLWGTAQANSEITAIGTKNKLLGKGQISKFLGKFKDGMKVEKTLA